jgi:hypothetical protein
LLNYQARPFYFSAPILRADKGEDEKKEDNGPKGFEKFFGKNKEDPKAKEEDKQSSKGEEDPELSEEEEPEKKEKAKAEERNKV